MTEAPVYIAIALAIPALIALWWLYRGARNTAKHAEHQKEQE